MDEIDIDGAKAQQTPETWWSSLEELNCSMRLYALVARDAGFAIDVYVTRESASAALEKVLADEPAWSELLEIRLLPDSTSAASQN